MCLYSKLRKYVNRRPEPTPTFPCKFHDAKSQQEGVILAICIASDLIIYLFVSRTITSEGADMLSTSKIETIDLQGGMRKNAKLYTNINRTEAVRSLRKFY